MKINPGKGMKYKKRLYVYTNKQTNGPRAITLKPYKMKILESIKIEKKQTFESGHAENYFLIFEIIKVGTNRPRYSKRDSRFEISHGKYLTMYEGREQYDRALSRAKK